jgi:hypothetical protein
MIFYLIDYLNIYLYIYNSFTSCYNIKISNRLWDKYRLFSLNFAWKGNIFHALKGNNSCKAHNLRWGEGHEVTPTRILNRFEYTSFWGSYVPGHGNNNMIFYLIDINIWDKESTRCTLDTILSFWIFHPSVFKKPFILCSPCRIRDYPEKNIS